MKKVIKSLINDEPEKDLLKEEVENLRKEKNNITQTDKHLNKVFNKVLLRHKETFKYQNEKAKKSKEQGINNKKDEIETNSTKEESKEIRDVEVIN